MKKTLHLHTTGEYLEQMTNDFFASGNFKNAIALLLSGDIGEIGVTKYITGRLKFTGSTKDPKGVQLEDVDSNEEVKKAVAIGVYTLYKEIKDRIYYYRPIIKEFVPELFEYVDDKLFKEYLASYVLDTLGWTVNPYGEYTSTNSGVMLQDGRIIEVNYMGHSDLYQDLYLVGLSKVTDWIDDNENIHISSGELNGTVYHQLRGIYDRQHLPTTEQLRALFLLQDKFNRGMEIGTKILEYYQELHEEKGQKHANLLYVKEFFSNIKTPKIYGDQPNFNRVGTLFLRTSPHESLPGILTSTVVSSQEEADKAIQEQQKKFEQYKYLTDFTTFDGKVVNHNKLKFFYQQLLEGKNGVAHIDSTGVSYSLSKNQGDVVLGKKGDSTLDSDEYNKLVSDILNPLYNTIQKPLQVEFVVTAQHEIYVVQLRVLKNNPEKTIILTEPDTVLIKGKTFSKGTLDEVSIQDILVVEEDALSEELVGKKALVVEADVAFSHILALSKMLNIPSIYGTGKVDFQGKDKVKFVAYNQNAWIL